MAFETGLGLAVALADGLALGLGDVLGLGVGVPGDMVGDIVAVGDGDTDGDGVGVAITQVPRTLNTMFISGNPIVAVSVGVAIPQSAALR
jgi:hypothetical protein